MLYAHFQKQRHITDETQNYKTPLIRQRYNLETPTIHLTMHQKDELNLTLIFNLKNNQDIQI